MKNVVKYLSVFIVLIVIVISFFIKFSYAQNAIVSSEKYEIKNNIIYAIPTTFKFRVEEFLSNVSSNEEIKVYDLEDKELSRGNKVGTGYKLKVNDEIFDIVVLGDLNGDGEINIGDVSLSYNIYRGRKSIDDLYKEFGKLINNSSITLGYVAKLYNYYRGLKPFTYYDKDMIFVDNVVDIADNYYSNNGKSSDLGNNIIDKLNIDHSDSDKVIITNQGQIELAIKMNNKCYRKSALNDSIDIIEEKLCNADISGFASNNGKLHVEGSKIINEYGREVVINGVSSGDVGNLNTVGTYQSIHTLKNWGGTGYRIFVDAVKNWGAWYINREDEIVEKVKKYIDNIIQNDMYVIVCWNPGEINAEEHHDKEIEFFTRLANLYPNDPHIIYEIWNEPETGNGSTWNDVKNTSNTIIPAIRNISPDSLVLVGLLNGSFSYALNNPIEFDNIMYTHHMYMNSLGGAYSNAYYLESYKNAIERGLPIFESEWGPMGLAQGEEMVIEPYAQSYFRFLKEHNISNLQFCFTQMNDKNMSYFGIVTSPNWKDDLPDSILKPNGIFMKNSLSNNLDTNVNVLLHNQADKTSEAAFYRNEKWADKIVSLEFKDKLEVPENTVVKWDLSLNRDNSIIGYLLETNENDRYNMVICANGIINAPRNSKYLFADLTNLKSIDFNNFRTVGLKNMNQMFARDAALESLDLSMFDVSKVQHMFGVFRDCTNIKNINIDGWNPKLSEIGWMFGGCQKLESMDLSNFDISEVTYFDGLFYNARSLKNVNISTWNPTSVNTIAKIFSHNFALETVDMSNFDFDDNTIITNALYGVKENATFKVKNENIKNKLSSVATNNVNFVY